MTEPSPEEPPNPDGSAGWDALPPDGEPPAEDDAEVDAEDTEDTERSAASGS